jgi:hypothetical protein
MVVQITRGVQRTHRPVDHRYAGTAFEYIGRHGRRVMCSRRRAAVSEDVVAPVPPQVMKVLSPRKLEHDLVLRFEPAPLRQPLDHLRHIDEAMRQVRRQPRHSAVEVVAGARVFARLDRIDAIHRRRNGGRESRCQPGIAAAGEMGIRE